MCVCVCLTGDGLGLTVALASRYVAHPSALRLSSCSVFLFVSDCVFVCLPACSFVPQPRHAQQSVSRLEYEAAPAGSSQWKGLSKKSVSAVICLKVTAARCGLENVFQVKCFSEINIQNVMLNIIKWCRRSQVNECLAKTRTLRKSPS